MKKFIIQLARKAGDQVNRRFTRDKVIKVKKKSQVVTEADLIADKIIVSALKKKFPDHAILSEESGRKKTSSKYLWAVDPIDGTTNYSIGSPLFAIGVSLFYENQPILAVAYAPAMNELYYAELGQGAYLNNRRIKVSKTANVKDAFLTFCHGSSQKDIKRALKVYQKIKLNSLDSRQLGSAAIEMAFVAAGRTDCIIIPGAHVWDVGPGTLLVREAGGRVTDFQGQDWNLKSKDMVASNGQIHEQLIKILRNI